MKQSFNIGGMLLMLMIVDGFASEPVPRLRRADSFFGLHFDLHAGDDCTEMGKDVTPGMVAAIIDAAQPDYIQCDCKGHRGLCSYPTKAGNPAPGFVRDPLRIWRDVTASRGVALYMHYSGVWDREAVNQHPEWAVLRPDGSRGGVRGGMTSVFGDYADKLLIPQLIELSDVYGVDGAWVDGECWATERDWNPNGLKKFRTETGILTVPHSADEKHWFEFSEFCREGFRNYLIHFVTKVHEHNPEFQIASNWAYTSFMPEEPNSPVDFISGDYDAINSVNSARLDGRVMVQQGKAWDLMAWSFTHDWDVPGGASCMKTPVQLKQEAAVVLALGGGFQAYFKQKRDASIYDWTLPLMKEIAEFCRDRQAVCHQAKPIPQIGLILSTHAYYRKLERLFAAWHGELNPFKGILQSLVHKQHVVDIVMEHHLRQNINRYPLLIWPEWENIDSAFQKLLEQYVRNGGNLIVIGPKAAELFEKQLGIELTGVSQEKMNGLQWGDWIANVKSESQTVSLQPGSRPFGRIYNQWIRKGPSQPAASIRKLGKGHIAGIYLNLGSWYLNGSTTVSRDFLSALVDTLFVNPILRVSGSPYVDVTLMEKNGHRMIHLINTAGPHANNDVYVFDNVPPIGPIQVKIRQENPPIEVYLEPGKREVDFLFVDHVLRIQIPKIEIHDVIVLK